MTNSLKRASFLLWLLAIAAFAILHAFHLRADFPNHSPWSGDYAKYTDEGWYSNAAVRAQLSGNWYLPGDFNPAPAVPVWPFLEWILFFFTGVSVQAARALAVSIFFVNLLLSYLLLRARGSPWMALLALTLLVTSPFLFCFSRLAILEPLLIAVLLAALNIAVRLDRIRRPVAAAALVGVLFTLAVLTKTTAVFLLPALVWAIAAARWPDRNCVFRCLAWAAAASAATFGAWMNAVIRAGLLRDFTYFFFVNSYPKPHSVYWPAVSLWWAFHGGLWADRVLFPLAGLVTLAVALCWRFPRARKLARDPVFGASILAVAGYLLFMTWQYHPQPRYFTVVAHFSFFVLVIGAETLLAAQPGPVFASAPATRVNWPRLAGAVAVATCCVMAIANGIWTFEYAAHPQYTWSSAAAALTRYIDQHPNGNRLLVSISGAQITLMTRLPSLCDDFGTVKLPQKLARYRPGWWATWNDIDPRVLAALHVHYSLEQVASFRALDNPDRNVLVLFKLHPLAHDRAPGPALEQPLPGDKINIELQ
ncbi:MAG TPA: phospholipid carrier-dependent glycosyltransferase [Terracidiphilus sp.]|nr:phospholipid carrier-dependent glycosyltransferase [Terracidiphilus sp.]